jgi:small acid-soluble spore protein E (minor gamma-type SASP)
MVILRFVEVIVMANRPNKTQAGTNIEQVRQQNAQSAQGGQFGTEFASETNAAEVRRQNAQSAQGGASQAGMTKTSGQGQYATEFGLESQTNAQEVRQQNQQAEARKSQNSGQFGQS